MNIDALRTLWKEAFGDTDAFLDVFFSTAFSADRCRYITIDGNVAAALYWFDCLYMDKPIAYIYAVATAKAYRGQGMCHKLMADTHQYLAECGYEGALLVPGNKKLFQLYENIGYQTCSSIIKFDVESVPEFMSLQRIDKEEYARLRRRFLPSGGVIQEHENLDFLETQADFYAGPDFLLTACADVDSFLGVEFLGNTSDAPKILYSLGYDKGAFRAPGNEVPFAMYYPLGNSELPAPSYFGLAFD